MKFNIYLISTGTEITTGKLVDTNSAWIANELSGLGFECTKIIALPDNPELIENEIRTHIHEDKNSLIIMTGGLGATADDYTLNVVCKVSGRNPEVDPSALDKLERIVSQRELIYQEILPVSKRQTMIPGGSIVLENEVGLACGFFIELSPRANLAALPGVPREMKRMFQEFFLPLFKKKYQAKELFTSSHSIWSVSEAVFQETFVKKNKSIIENGVEWGVTAKPGHINVTFKSREKQPIQNIEEKLSNDYKELIGDDIFHFIHDMLVSHRKTISTAESCTGGLVGKIITDMPGSSSYYIGSIIAYHNDVKSKLISVKKETIIQDGAVSEDAASEMATGVQNLLSTDYSISVTGIAGPTGGTKDKRVGLVFIGIKSGKEKPEVFRYEFPFNREAFREYVANISLFHLFKKLKKDLGNIL